MTRAQRLATLAVAMAVTCGLAADASAHRRVRVTVVSEPTIEDAMRAALAGAPELDVVPRARAELELRGTVNEVRRRHLSDGVEVSARVTVVVADARGGAVRAMLTGRAGARGGGDPERLTRSALDAAVRTALRSFSDHRAAIARR